MSSAYKTSKAELVAIYRLEFYRQKKNWKLCKDVLKEKDSKAKDAQETKPAKKKPVAEIEKPAKNLLDKTYVLDKPASGINDAFFESESDTNLTKKPTEQTKEESAAQSKEEPTVWTNSCRNIALTSILQSEASKKPDFPPIPDAEVRDVTDGQSHELRKPWSEELEWQEGGGRQVFQPELWSPTRESPLCFSPDKVWSKEDQIWPQSPESWPEPVLWRDNELVWPAAGQQPGPVDDEQLVWPPAGHQRLTTTGEAELLWTALRQRRQKVGPTKLVWPDDIQQVRSDDPLHWPPDSNGEGERWEAFQEWIEGVPQELEPPAPSPEALVPEAREWLPEPLGGHDDWLDSCEPDSDSRSLCEFMRGAHCRRHSSEIELSCSGELEARAPAALSGAALSARARRHAAALRALLSEARARAQLSAELEEYAHHPHESSSYEEFPTRDVGLQGPPGQGPPRQGPPCQGPKQDHFISGSHLNNPCFDLETSCVGPFGLKTQLQGRGRGRLVRDGRSVGHIGVGHIGIGPGGRPYRM